jgi:adenylate cyclase
VSLLTGSAGRSFVVAATAAALFAAAGGAALFPWTQGPSIDALHVLREVAYGPRPATQPGRVVVVGIDEETYRRPPFAGTPQAMWTPQLGRVLAAAHQAGAAAVGVDLIYPTSVETLIPGFERPYMLALRDAGRAGKLVLAKVQHQTHPILPFRGHVAAVGGAANLRSVNLAEDPDGVLRRAPISFVIQAADGTAAREPGFALEVAARALGVKPDIAPDGAATLAGYVIPGATGAGMPINHPTAVGAVPTYSLADLYACAEAGRSDYFKQHFAGKTVLVGTTLDVEDRKLSSNRRVTKPEGAAGPERCVLPVMEGLTVADRVRDTIPGVYIHAAAVGNLLAGDGLREASPLPSVGLYALLAGATATATALLSPALAAAALAGIAAAWTGAATAAFHGGLILPWLSGLIAAAAAFPALIGFRFAVVDRDRRHVRNAFKLYLPAEVIDDMMRSGGAPRLGGEARNVSILFSDIAGYTKMSEGLEPEELVAILNRYFTSMTDIVEKHGGFVDKFIGDAVLAVFGAPRLDPAHAAAAVAAALEMQATLADDPTLLDSGRGARGSIRIGIADGPALIGNIGSPRRFNYTVMGDTVNLASRLEGVNKQYGSGLLVSEATARATGDLSAFREVDSIRVVGRDEPAALFEPLSAARRVDPVDAARRAAYAAGLALWRAGDFAAAHAAFAPLADEDVIAAAMARRAAAYAAKPPAGVWTGVTSFTEK